MLKKLQALTVLMCMFSYATAETAAIGTASARGEIHVDSYAVKGNATLFDGSVVETAQASADLRLDKSTSITMSTNSRGILYRDRMVLQRGESELATSGSFQLEANGLRVSPNGPNSRGVVTLKAGNTVAVSARNGSFGVISGNGVLLASVRPGLPMTFAMQSGASTTSFSGTGLVSFEDGHYYITLSDTNVKYEIVGKNLKKYVGDKVAVYGTVQAGAQQASGAPAVVTLNSISVNGDQGFGVRKSLLICGVVVGAGIGIGFAVADANQSSTPASR